MTNKVRTWIKRTYPPMAKHLADLGEILNIGQWKEAMKYMVPENGPQRDTIVLKEYQISVWTVVDREGFPFVVCASECLLMKCQLSTILKIDGTFKIAPQLEGVYQVVTFMGDVGDDVIKYLIYFLLLP